MCIYTVDKKYMQLHERTSSSSSGGRGEGEGEADGVCGAGGKERFLVSPCFTISPPTEPAPMTDP